LVLADIINNNELSIVYHDLIVLMTWLYIWFWYRLSLLIDVRYVGHLTSTHDLIGYLILLMIVLLLSIYIMHVYSVLFQYILSSYTHMLYACAPSPLFLHIH